MANISPRYSIPVAPIAPPIQAGRVTDVQAQTARLRRKWLDVRYAEISDAETLDVYLPNEGAGSFPLLIVIHGGGFALGDKNGPELALVLEPAISKGYAVASINYRLSGEASFPAAIKDVKAAIRFLRANAGTYLLNPNKIGLWGFSAGANLAALAGTTDKMSAFVNPVLGNPLVSEQVTCVVDFYGSLNFLTMEPQFITSGTDGVNPELPNSFESRYLGSPITRVPWLVKEADPQTYLAEGCPPFFIEHGTQDRTVPYQQSVVFSQALNQVVPATDIRLRLLEGASHGGPQFETQENLSQVFDFLNQYMKMQ